MSLKTFAFSLIAIFIPIYLYNLGYSIRNIIAYFVLVYLFCSLGEYFSGRLVSKYGAKHVMAISFPLMAISLIFLLTLKDYHWPLWFLAITAAAPMPFFWVPYHDDFSKAKHQKTAGKEIGRLAILVAFFGALGPFIGGMIAEEVGMQIAIATSTILLLAAIPALFRSREIVKQRPMNMRNFSIRRNARDMLAYSGYGLEASASMVLWPFFLYLIVGSYKGVGFIATASLMVAIAVMIFVGKITDKYSKRKVLKMGGILNFSTGVSRVIVSSLGAAYFVSVISSISQIFLQIPFVSEYYLRADEEPRTEYIVGMEMTIDFARGFGFLILFFSTYFLDIKWVLMEGIVMGAFGALLSTYITRSATQEAVSVVKSPVEV